MGLGTKNFGESVKVVGCDIFIAHQEGVPQVPEHIGQLKLVSISNRGTKVWPGPPPKIHLTDVHTCRFVSINDGAPVESKEIIALLGKIEEAGFEWVHIEKLLEINGQAGFSKAQGE